jgi:hypothetical protein
MSVWMVVNLVSVEIKGLFLRSLYENRVTFLSHVQDFLIFLISYRSCHGLKLSCSADAVSPHATRSVAALGVHLAAS